jgi:hypothetical protein
MTLFRALSRDFPSNTHQQGRVLEYWEGFVTALFEVPKMQNTQLPINQSHTSNAPAFAPRKTHSQRAKFQGPPP